MIIGAPNNDAGGTDAGRAYVFGLDRSPVSAATRFTPTGTVASLGMGNSVAGAGTSTATGIRTRSSGCEAASITRTCITAVQRRTRPPI